MKHINRNAYYKYLVLLVGLFFFTPVVLQAKPMKNARPILGWREYLTRAPFFNYTTYTPPMDISKNGCKAGKLVTFAQKIEAIACKVGDWTDPKALLKSKDFLAIYKHPHYYWEENMAYITNPNYPEAQKQIAIYAMELLDTDIYVTYVDACYQLYTDNKISDSLLHTVICFDLLQYQFMVYEYKNRKVVDCLERILATPNLPAQLIITINKILSGEILAAWNQKKDTYHYRVYNHPFKFSKIINQAEQELLAYYNGGFCNPAPKDYDLSNFLVLLDHPLYYHGIGIEGTEDSANFFVGMPKFSSTERRLAIFAMQRLDVLQYAEFIKEICSYYRGGNISPQMIEDLFYCFYETGSKLPYPFAMMDYKHPSLQEALDKLIAIPTLPCGLKDLARKAQNGTLATKAEMAYMEGYRQFRKTHFTLYETVPPRDG